MKKTALACAAIAIASSAPLGAAPKKPDNGKPATEKSNRGQGSQEGPRSQGHLHANLAAVANVCGKDNPAASRSALCTPKPASPN